MNIDFVHYTVRLKRENIIKQETYSVPRFLSFIDWAYLEEAMKVTDAHFEKELSKTDDRNKIGNLNATRQSLHRAAFISIMSTLEQNMDELVRIEKDKKEIELSPSELKHRGIKRSLVYAKKILKQNIDDEKQHWKDVVLLQELRNQLVHYGPEFSGQKENTKLVSDLKKCEYVSFHPIACFSLEQITLIIQTCTTCVEDFTGE